MSQSNELLDKFYQFIKDKHTKDEFTNINLKEILFAIGEFSELHEDYLVLDDEEYDELIKDIQWSAENKVKTELYNLFMNESKDHWEHDRIEHAEMYKEIAKTIEEYEIN